MPKPLFYLLTCILLGVVQAGCTNNDKSGDLRQLRRKVDYVHKMLETNQHAEVVKTLFLLEDPNEISIAVECLRRPRCLEMYEKMFAIISTLKPTKGELPSIAYYQFENFELSYDTFDKMQIMFIYDGTHWVFHDPSFERKLKRKLAPDFDET